MKKQYLLFDVDGTLTDPMTGITKSVQYALRYYGIEEENLDQLCRFIGPPLKDSFMEYYGFDEAQAREAIGKYREYFKETGIFENQAYPGIEKLLSELKKQGKKLLTASSKPEVFVRRILEHFQLDSYFDLIGGADLEETRVRKEDVIRYVMDQYGIGDVREAIMIGDREHDILGAKAVGMESVGVLYGYGSMEELKGAGADYIVDTVENLRLLWRN